VPLRGPSGLPIGSLCLLDTKPRKFSEQERRLLETFADDLLEEIKSRAPREEPGEKHESILQRIKEEVISQGKEWTPELEKKFKAGIQVWFPN
jgi:GAF domain-containing protein